MTFAANSDLILASASPRRLQLMAQLGLEPDKIVPADIDETAYKSEMPLAYAKRMADEKASLCPSVATPFILLPSISKSIPFK